MAPTVNFQATKMNGVGGDISLLEEATRDQAESHTENICLQFGLPERVKLLKTAGINLHLETFKSKHRRLRTKGICLF